MKPYRFKKLTEQPDVLDILIEGRASHVGKVKSGRGYSQGTKRKAARRHLKRADKSKLTRQVREDERDSAT